MNVFKMAWRNVWRNTRRSLVTIGAITFALCLMVLYAGIIEGHLRALEADVVNMEVGDIQIFAPSYREDPSLYAIIKESDQLANQLQNLGYRASPRLLGGGLSASGEFSAGVTLRGIDIQRDKTVTLVHERVEHGQWLNASNPQGVVIGKKLAQTLNAKVGAELILLSQAADGSMANDLYSIRGILENVGDATDRTGVFMLASTYRELMSFPEGAHQLIVRRPEAIQLPAALDAVSALAPTLDVKSWPQLMPTVASMLEMAEGMIGVIFTIMYLAIGILLLNAMLMAVFERIREFGVFKALGAGPTLVFSLIFVEAMIQMSIAIALGTVLSIPGIWYLSTIGINVGALGGASMMGLAFRSILYGIYSPEIVAPAYKILIVIVVLSVLYPALKAAWIKPVDSMRHQ